MADTEAPNGDESPDSHIALARVVLGLPSLAEQQAFLRASDRLDAMTVDALLDVAEDWMGEDPAQTRQLAHLCSALAEEMSDFGLAARGAYVCARTYFINAEFDAALSLIDAARRNYLRAGLPREALRTDVGRMGVLNEVGRYVEALGYGRNIINALSEAGDPSKVSADAEVNQLIGMAQQNSGMAYLAMGNFERALQAYAAAEDRYHALNLPERMGDLRNNRGVVLLGLGRVREALVAFENAAALFDVHAASLKRAGAHQPRRCTPAAGATHAGVGGAGAGARAARPHASPGREASVVVGLGRCAPCLELVSRGVGGVS